MTVCIAASANRSSFIVGASDTMLSTPNMKSESAVMKLRTIGRWTLMFAGETGDADLVMDDLSSDLMTASTKQEIKGVITTAYDKRFGEFSAGRWLACYGLDMPTFRKEGAASFTQSTFDGLCRQIAEDSINFSLQMLIYGWIPNSDVAQIFSMDRDGFHSHCVDGFAAIGSGSGPASTSLMFQGYAPHLHLPRVIGQVCMAKFMAEYSDGVGRVTLVHVKTTKEEHSFFVQPYEIEKIREFWTDAGLPRTPQGLDEFIYEIIKERVQLNPK